MSQDDLYGAPAGWYPDPLGLPQLRWWNNHAWTEQTSAARQPMVVQDTKFAWADDDLPTRRDERLRDRNDRTTTPTVAPTAEALRELEPPRAFTQVGESAQTTPSVPVTPPVNTQAPHDPFVTTDPFVAADPYKSADFSAPDPFNTSEPIRPAEPLRPTEPIKAPEPFAAAESFATAESFTAADVFNAPPPTVASTESAPPVASLYTPDPVLYTPDPVVESPIVDIPAVVPTPSLATIFDARPIEAPQEALNALFGEPALRRAGTRVKTPIVTIDHVASTATGAAAKVAGTGPAWVIAMIPLFQVVLSVLLLNTLGQGGNMFFYWAVLVLPYFVTIALAYVDHGVLVKAGHRNPAHWGWAVATAPTYLLMRARAVIAETGHGIGPVLAWFGLGLLHLASFVAVPGILIALLPAMFTTQIEEAVVYQAMAIADQAMTVDCQGAPPVLPGETITCQSVTGQRESDIVVTLVRSNGWIGWQVIDWGRFK